MPKYQKINIYIYQCVHTDIKALGLMVSDKKIFSIFHYISLCKTCDPKEGGCNFWPKGHNLKELGRDKISCSAELSMGKVL